MQIDCSGFNNLQKCHITVHFRPYLFEADVREEAVRVMKVQKEEEKRRLEQHEAREAAMLSSKVQEEDKNVKKFK